MNGKEWAKEWAIIKTQVIESNRESGKFTSATVEYWLEWLEAKAVNPTSPNAILAWIAEIEYEIGHVIDSEIPSEWIAQ